VAKTSFTGSSAVGKLRMSCVDQSDLKTAHHMLGTLKAGVVWVTALALVSASRRSLLVVTSKAAIRATNTSTACCLHAKQIGVVQPRLYPPHAKGTT
jgi:hypothetical protein